MHNVQQRLAEPGGFARWRKSLPKTVLCQSFSEWASPPAHAEPARVPVEEPTSDSVKSEQVTTSPLAPQ
jgi:hypothetical protein